MQWQDPLQQTHMPMWHHADQLKPSAYDALLAGCHPLHHLSLKLDDFFSCPNFLGNWRWKFSSYIKIPTSELSHSNKNSTGQVPCRARQHVDSALTSWASALRSVTIFGHHLERMWTGLTMPSLFTSGRPRFGDNYFSHNRKRPRVISCVYLTPLQFLRAPWLGPHLHAADSFTLYDTSVGYFQESFCST